MGVDCAGTPSSSPPNVPHPRGGTPPAGRLPTPLPPPPRAWAGRTPIRGPPPARRDLLTPKRGRVGSLLDLPFPDRHRHDAPAELINGLLGGGSFAVGEPLALPDRDQVAQAQPHAFPLTHAPVRPLQPRRLLLGIGR